LISCPANILAGRGAESAALGDSERVQLRIRGVAMGSPPVTSLSEASAPRLEPARDMASYVSPRRSTTRRHMTIHTATQIRRLVGRASQVRGGALS